MLKKNLNIYLCDYDVSLKEALLKIEKNARGILFVVKRDVLIGVITDGDIRRLLLGEQFDGGIKVGSVCNKEFVCAFDTDPDEKIISLFSSKIKCLPVITQNKKIIDIQFNNQIRHNLSSSKIYARAPARITFGGGGSDKLDYFSQKNGTSRYN